MIWTTLIKRLVARAVVSVTFVALPMSADIIAYQATSFAPAATLGSTTLDSCPASNRVCVEVTINFLANTSNIVPFSVSGASGFENFKGQGSVTLFNDQTAQLITANFLPDQIFLSVDQTNGGIGFGSVAGGPTYPLGVYGGTPSVPYSTYNLGCVSCFPGQRAFELSNGFAWFCPPSTCTLNQPGPDLATDQGSLSITIVGPVLGSSFDATVIKITSVTEPSTVLLVGAGIVIFVCRRSWREGPVASASEPVRSQS